MSLLLGQLKKLVNDDEQSKIWNDANEFSAPTGFTVFDVMSTSMERSRFGDYNIPNGGLFPRIYSAVGESDVGKTTHAIQLMAAATDYCTAVYGPYVEFVMYDIEKHTSIERIKAVARWSDKDVYEKLRFVHKKMTIEEIFTELQQICNAKEQMKDKLMQTTPIMNLDGSKHNQYYPTFVLIDSIAALRDFKEIEVNAKGEVKETENMVENIEAMRTAKKNTSFVFQVKQLCSDYNIVLMLINHIKTETAMSMFDRPTKYLLHLKAGEKLSGGNELIFQSAFMTKLFHGKKIDDANDIYGDNVRGSINKFTYVKNKNGKEGLLFPYVFDTDKGYMPEISDFETLLEYKYGISGTSAYYLDILPEVKLTRRTLLDTCYNNPLVARAIQFTAKALLYPMLVFNTTPVDLALEFRDMPIEDRIAMIMQFTVDYPGYINQKRIVTEECIKKLTENKSELKFGERFTKVMEDLALMKIDLWKKGYNLQEQSFGASDIIQNNIDKDGYIYFKE